MIVHTYGCIIILTAGFLAFAAGDIRTTSATVQFRNTTTNVNSSSVSNTTESPFVPGNTSMTTTPFAINNSTVITATPPGNTTESRVTSNNSNTTTAFATDSSTVAAPSVTSSYYDIVEGTLALQRFVPCLNRFALGTADAVSAITELPCWGKSARRAGRIVLKRKDFLKSSSFRLAFRFYFCQSEGHFTTGQRQVDFDEDLYLDVRSNEMDPSLASIDQEFVTVSSKYRLYSVDDDGAEVSVPFSETIRTSRRHFHAVLNNRAPPVVWTDGPEFQVFLYRLPLVFFNATNNFTLLEAFHNTSMLGMNITANTTFDDLNDPVLMQKDLLIIDYTIVLRPRGRNNTIDAAYNFQQTNPSDMNYCPSFRGFIPKQLCPNSVHNTLGVTSCPQRHYVSEYLSPITSETETDCWNMPQTINTLSSMTTESSTPSTRRTTWKPSSSYYDSYYDYRMMGIGVALAVTFVSFSCALLKYCCRIYYRRRMEALAAQGVYRIDSAASSRRNSGDGPMVYGACHARPLDSPPSYEEVIRSGSSTPVEKGSSNNLMGFGSESVSAPMPVLVIATPSRALPIDSDSSS